MKLHVNIFVTYFTKRLPHDLLILPHEASDASDGFSFMHYSETCFLFLSILSDAYLPLGTNRSANFNEKYCQRDVLIVKRALYSKDIIKSIRRTLYGSCLAQKLTGFRNGRFTDCIVSPGCKAVEVNFIFYLPHLKVDKRRAYAFSLVFLQDSWIWNVSFSLCCVSSDAGPGNLSQEIAFRF